MEEKDNSSGVSLSQSYGAGTITTVAPDAASKKYVIADQMTPSVNMEMQSCPHYSPLLDIRKEMLTDSRHKKQRARKITASSLRQAQKGLKKLDSVEKKRIEQKSSGAATAAAMMQRFMEKRVSVAYYKLKMDYRKLKVKLLLNILYWIFLSFKFESISEEEISQDEEFSDDDFYYDSEEHVVDYSSDCAGMTHK